MLKKLQDFVASLKSTKQITMIKHNVELYNWVLETTQNKTLSSESISEKIFVILNPSSDNTCCPNKLKKFIGFNEGYARFCGSASKCPKCKASVVKSSSDSHSKRTRDKIDASNKLREKTFQNKHKVSHNSQLPAEKNIYKNFTKIQS